MGTWQSVVREPDLTEPSAGAGIESSARYPEPGEGYLYVVKRTDAADQSEPWLAELQVSVDVAADEWVTLRSIRKNYAAADLLIAFPVRGPIPACRIRASNDQNVSPTDIVIVDVDFQRDAVVL
jgi:hypothetical protein